MLRRSLTKVTRFTLLLGLFGPIGSGISHAQPQPDARAASLLKLQQLRRQMWLDQLNAVGVKEDTTQTAILGEVTIRHQGLVPVNQQVKELVNELMKPDADDEKVKPLLADIRSSLAQEKVRRAEASVDLSKRLSLSDHARLETSLTYLGIVGDDAHVLDSIPQSLLRLRVDSVAQALRKLNVTDAQVTGNILAYTYQQERLFEPVLQWANESETALGDNGEELTEEQVRQQLSYLHEHIAQLENRREGALAKLDTKIGYSRNPRLEAALFLAGILDSDISLLDELNMHGVTRFQRYKNIVTGQKR